MIAISLVVSLLSCTTSGKEITVTYSDSPIWTVGIGVGYADMSITLGETLELSSYSSHDVVLIHAPSTGTYWDQCGQNGIAVGNFTSIWAATDFTGHSITQKHYTPPTCGDFYVTCSVPPHCMYGQRVKVTVKNVDDTLCTSPCLNAACVTTASKVSKATVHSVKPMPNSGFWGQGPYGALTVDIGDTVLFRTGGGFHDVATVPSTADFDNCDMTSMVVVADWPYMQMTPTAACNSSSACCSGSTCGVASPYVTYTFTAKMAGDTYFVCSYGNGGHCKTGQKFRVTVRDAATSPSPSSSSSSSSSSAGGSANNAGQCTAQFFSIAWVLVAFYVQCSMQ